MWRGDVGHVFACAFSEEFGPLSAEFAQTRPSSTVSAEVGPISCLVFGPTSAILKVEILKVEIVEANVLEANLLEVPLLGVNISEIAFQESKILQGTILEMKAWLTQVGRFGSISAILEAINPEIAKTKCLKS